MDVAPPPPPPELVAARQAAREIDVRMQILYQVYENIQNLNRNADAPDHIIAARRDSFLRLRQLKPVEFDVITQTIVNVRFDGNMERFLAQWHTSTYVKNLLVYNIAKRYLKLASDLDKLLTRYNEVQVTGLNESILKLEKLRETIGSARDVRQRWSDTKYAEDADYRNMKKITSKLLLSMYLELEGNEPAAEMRFEELRNTLVAKYGQFGPYVFFVHQKFLIPFQNMQGKTLEQLRDYLDVALKEVSVSIPARMKEAKAQYATAARRYSSAGFFTEAHTQQRNENAARLDRLAERLKGDLDRYRLASDDEADEMEFKKGRENIYEHTETLEKREAGQAREERALIYGSEDEDSAYEGGALSELSDAANSSESEEGDAGDMGDFIVPDDDEPIQKRNKLRVCIGCGYEGDDMHSTVRGLHSDASISLCSEECAHTWWNQGKQHH